MHRPSRPQSAQPALNRNNAPPPWRGTTTPNMGSNPTSTSAAAASASSSPRRILTPQVAMKIRAHSSSVSYCNMGRPPPLRPQDLVPSKPKHGGGLGSGDTAVVASSKKHDGVPRGDGSYGGKLLQRYTPVPPVLRTPETYPFVAAAEKDIRSRKIVEAKNVASGRTAGGAASGVFIKDMFVENLNVHELKELGTELLLEVRKQDNVHDAHERLASEVRLEINTKQFNFDRALNKGDYQKKLLSERLRTVSGRGFGRESPKKSPSALSSAAGSRRQLRVANVHSPIRSNSMMRRGVGFSGSQQTEGNGEAGIIGKSTSIRFEQSMLMSSSTAMTSPRSGGGGGGGDKMLQSTMTAADFKLLGADEGASQIFPRVIVRLMRRLAAARERIARRREVTAINFHHRALVSRLRPVWKQWRRVMQARRLVVRKRKYRAFEAWKTFVDDRVLAKALALNRLEMSLLKYRSRRMVTSWWALAMTARALRNGAEPEEAVRNCTFLLHRRKSSVYQMIRRISTDKGGGGELLEDDDLQCVATPTIPEVEELPSSSGEGATGTDQQQEEGFSRRSSSPGSPIVVDLSFLHQFAVDTAREKHQAETAARNLSMQETKNMLMTSMHHWKIFVALEKKEKGVERLLRQWQSSAVVQHSTKKFCFTLWRRRADFERAAAYYTTKLASSALTKWTNELNMERAIRRAEADADALHSRRRKKFVLAYWRQKHMKTQLLVHLGALTMVEKRSKVLSYAFLMRGETSRFQVTFCFQRWRNYCRRRKATLEFLTSEHTEYCRALVRRAFTVWVSDGEQCWETGSGHVSAETGPFEATHNFLGTSQGAGGGGGTVSNLDATSVFAESTRGGGTATNIASTMRSGRSRSPAPSASSYGVGSIRPSNPNRGPSSTPSSGELVQLRLAAVPGRPSWGLLPALPWSLMRIVERQLRRMDPQKTKQPKISDVVALPPMPRIDGQQHFVHPETAKQQKRKQLLKKVAQYRAGPQDFHEGGQERTIDEIAVMIQFTHYTTKTKNVALTHGRGYESLPYFDGGFTASRLCHALVMYAFGLRHLQATRSLFSKATADPVFGNVQEVLRDFERHLEHKRLTEEHGGGADTTNSANFRSAELPAVYTSGAGSGGFPPTSASLAAYGGGAGGINDSFGLAGSVSVAGKESSSTPSPSHLLATLGGGGSARFPPAHLQLPPSMFVGLQHSQAMLRNQPGSSHPVQSHQQHHVGTLGAVSSSGGMSVVSGGGGPSSDPLLRSYDTLSQAEKESVPIGADLSQLHQHHHHRSGGGGIRLLNAQVPTSREKLLYEFMVAHRQREEVAFAIRRRVTVKAALTTFIDALPYSHRETISGLPDIPKTVAMLNEAHLNSILQETSSRMRSRFLLTRRDYLNAASKIDFVTGPPSALMAARAAAAAKKKPPKKKPRFVQRVITARITRLVLRIAILWRQKGLRRMYGKHPIFNTILAQCLHPPPKETVQILSSMLSPDKLGAASMSSGSRGQQAASCRGGTSAGGGPGGPGKAGSSQAGGATHNAGLQSTYGGGDQRSVCSGASSPSPSLSPYRQERRSSKTNVPPYQLLSPADGGIGGVSTPRVTISTGDDGGAAPGNLMSSLSSPVFREPVLMLPASPAAVMTDISGMFSTASSGVHSPPPQQQLIG